MLEVDQLSQNQQNFRQELSLWNEQLIIKLMEKGAGNPNKKTLEAIKSRKRR